MIILPILIKYLKYIKYISYENIPNAQSNKVYCFIMRTVMMKTNILAQALFYDKFVNCNSMKNIW